MLKVKVFLFFVSNLTSACSEDEEGTRGWIDANKKLATPEIIEDTINNFSESHDIQSISVNTVDVRYHNNARGNNIDLTYTILYRE